MKINYGRHYIDSQDIKEVIKVLKSNHLTQGPTTEKFEKKINLFFGSNYCVSTSSGTAALHLVMLALDLKKNDVVISSPLTFVASANSVLYTKSNVEFVDIDRNYLTLSIKKLEEKIIELKKKKKKLKAVVVTDYGGQPADWHKLQELSKKNGFYLINDNCHAIGTTYCGDIKYACKYADFVIHSYHPVKAITTCEGGAVLTNNKKYYLKIKSLRSHGIIREKKKYWKYNIKNLGYNYRLSDLHASLGISQLKKIKKFLKKRREVAEIYDAVFKNLPGITVPKKKKNCENSYHLYFLRINFKKFKIKKDLFLKKLNQLNIYLQVHYVPIYYFDLYNFYKKKKFNNTEEYYKETVSLPIYYDLKRSEILTVIKSIKKLLKI